MSDLTTFFIVIAVGLLITSLLVNTASNIGRKWLLRRSDAYAELRDHRSHIVLYVKKSTVFTNHGPGDLTVQEYESRNYALIAWANKCNLIAQNIYNRG